MPFNDLARQQSLIKDKVNSRILDVLNHGRYILGPEVDEFELKLAQFCGAKYAVSCANGTDALLLALIALGVKETDAIFVPSFTFVGTAEIIPYTGATAFFVDCDLVTYNMDVDSLNRCIFSAKQLGLNPAVIMPVDLFGLPANYKSICQIAVDEGMKVIGDSAQGFGGSYKGSKTGTLCDITTTSFFPAKPLGCYGDGGAVLTNDKRIAKLVRSLRFHGKGDQKYDNVRIGMNSRLDTIQAAILLEKLEIFAAEIETRQVIAHRYEEGLSQIITTPTVPADYQSVWAQYTLKARSNEDRAHIIDSLNKHGIPTNIYYPVPLHLQPAYRGYPFDPAGLSNSEHLANVVFSLPMHPYLESKEQEFIIRKLSEKILQLV